MPKSRPIELIARGLLIDRSRILVCRNRNRGYAFLPGGHIEFGEAATSALVREFAEECGLEVKAKECLLITEEAFADGRKRHHELNVVFHVELARGQASRVVSREKEIEFEWCLASSISMIDFRPLTVRDWLASGAPFRGGTPTASWLSSMLR